MRRNTCRVRFDEGVDGSDDTVLVAAVVAVRVGSGGEEVVGRDGVIDRGRDGVIDRGRDGVIDRVPAVAYRLEFVALAADSIMSWKVQEES